MNSRRIKWWVCYVLPAFFYSVLIVYLSSLSDLPSPMPGFYGSDKLLHGCEYFLFGYLIMRSLVVAVEDRSSTVPALATVILGGFFGLSDEIHQAFVPGREASLMDFLFDMAGLAAAVLAFSFLRRRFGPLRFIEDWIEEVR